MRPQVSGGPDSAGACCIPLVLAVAVREGC